MPRLFTLSLLLSTCSLLHYVSAQLNTTFSSCTSQPDPDCDGICVQGNSLDNVNLCSGTGESPCFCVLRCSASSDCQTGTLCATISILGSSYCLPCEALDVPSPPSPVDDDFICPTATPGVSTSSVTSSTEPSTEPSTVPPTTPSAVISLEPSPAMSSPDPSPAEATPSSSKPAPAPSISGEPGDGLTLDLCFLRDLSCQGSRKCSSFQQSVIQGKPVPCTDNDGPCVCMPPTTTKCSTSSVCSEGERCAEVVGVSSGTCASCTTDLAFSNTVNYTDDGAGKCAPCIAADHLDASDGLVYNKHIRGAVLCDEFNNCATPGHIVVHNGVAMMMKSYCDMQEQTCRRVVKFVNNPKMKRALRIQSNSKSLQFTAFSAKYESALEERLIRAVVHSGF